MMQFNTRVRSRTLFAAALVMLGVRKRTVRHRTLDASNAILYRMAAGVPGDVTRSAMGLTVEPQIITTAGQANAPAAYGIGVLLDATTGKVRQPTAGDTAIYGILVRPFPIQGQTPNEPLGTNTPPVQGTCDVLRRGYIAALVSGVTGATKNGPVYCRTVAAANRPVGAFEAAADGGNSFLVPNAFWMGPADANGISEIAYNI
jgi:hypothetical protein